MKSISLLLTLISLFATPLSAQDANRSDRNESPYFEIRSEKTKSGDMALLSSKVSATIAGPIANVTITQLYKNNGTYPIEAVYVFPASTRAAVYEMSMKIEDRIITADIQEKKQALQTYQKAKKEGKRASLLEQHRPNVFQMQVANILPGDEIEVILKYNELLVPEEQIYSFIYPTVVGPRYSNQTTVDATAHQNINYGNAGQAPSYDFDLEIYLNAGMPIQESWSPTHNVDIDYTNLNSATLALQQGENKSGNKDFIFNYKIVGDEIGQGTLLYQHEDENFFLSMIQPPKRLEHTKIPPREYVFVVDVSGSMFGFPINISKRLMKSLIGKLRPEDSFNILLFAGGSNVLAQSSLAANQENLANALKFIDKENGGGGTELLPALNTALALPNYSKDLSRSIIVITDGYVNVERETFKTIANNLGRSNLFAFGIGSSVNRNLIEGMAHAGQGEAFIITDEKYAQRTADKFEKYILEPILTNIELSYEDFDVYDVTSLSFPDLMAERPIYVFGKYKGDAKGSMTLTGYQRHELFTHTVDINTKLINNSNNPIRYLWAREKIRWLDDLNAAASDLNDIKTITNLGLKYNLLTNYTSFVAVEEKPVLPNDRSTKTVKQRLPLPHGISNHAVGFELLVNGITEINECSEKILFVHVSGEANKNAKRMIKNLLTQKIVFTKEEKKFLDNNTLQISYDKNNDRWTILALKKELSFEFVEQLKDVLSNMQSLKGNSFHAEINLLWV